MLRVGNAAFVLAAAVFGLATAAGAQEPRLRDRVAHRIGVWGGLSTANPRVFAGITDGLDLALVAGRASWRLAAGDRYALEWMVEVYPAAWLTGRPDIRLPEPAPEGSIPPVRELQAFGVGLAPLGLRGLIGISPRLRLSLETGAGMMFFTRPVPNELGRGANFTYQIGAALEHDIDQRRSLMLGYRLLHISNAGSAVWNPGIENGVLHFGLLLRR